MKPVIVGGGKQPEPSKADKTPEQAVSQPTPVKPAQKGIMQRIAEIVVDDINYKLHGIRTKDREKWERYNRFCELAEKESKGK